MSLSNLRIVYKLGLSFAMVVGLAGCVGILAIVKMNGIGVKTHELADNQIPSITLLSDYYNLLNYYRRTEVQLLLEIPDDRRKSYSAQLADRINNFDPIEAAYEPLIASATEREKFVLLKAQRRAYAASYQHISTGSADAQARLETTKYFMNESRAMFFATTKTLDELIAINRQNSKQSAADAISALKSGRDWMVGMLIVIVASATLLSILLTRAMGRSLRTSIKVSQRIAGGDLAIDFPAGGTDEFGELIGALRQMRNKIAEVVGDVRSNAEGVATASAQIAQGNNDLSARTEQQASALQETAASMEQLSSTVRQNADNAHQANQLAS